MVRLRVLLILSAALMFASPGARAATLVYTAFLDGPSEDTPNASPGTGFAQVNIDTILHTIRIQILFGDLLGPTTVAHIHAPTAIPGTGAVGVAVTPGTLPGFPAGVTSGSYDQTLDLTSNSTYTGNFLTNSGGGTVAGAEAAFLAAIAEGRAYVNVHSTSFPAGEIRGFLQPVPEPTSVLMLGIGVIGGVAYGRRRLGRTHA